MLSLGLVLEIQHTSFFHSVALSPLPKVPNSLSAGLFSSDEANHLFAFHVPVLGAAKQNEKNAFQQCFLTFYLPNKTNIIHII